MKGKLWMILTVIGMAIFLSVMLAVPTLAAAYTYNITITNPSNTDLTSSPWIASINNSGLVSQGYLSSTGLDAKVMDGSTALPTLVTNDKTLFVDSLNGNQSKTIQYTTGNSPATSMPIIVGQDGYFVTPYVSGMDLGTKFTVTINAYFDMTQSGTIMETGGFYIGMGEDNIYGEIDETSNECDFELPNVASGVHSLTMSGDGSHYAFSIDSPSDADYQTQVETETTGVPVEQQEFQWDSASGNPYNTMPYINSIQVHVTPAENSNTSITSMIFAANYVFAGMRNNTSGDVSILKIDPVSGTVVDTWDLGMTASAYGIACLYYDGTDLYAGLGIFDRSQFQEQGMIIQFTPDLSEVNDWEDSNYGFGGVGINYLTGGDGMIYGAGDGDGSYGVVQIDPSDMQMVGSYTQTDAGDYGGNPLTEGGNGPLTGIALIGDSLYCAETYTPGADFCGVFIIKLAFYGLSQEGAHRIFTDEMASPYANYQATSLTTDGTSLYCGIEETLVQDSAWVTQPYKVVKIDTAMDVFATYTTSNSLFNGVSSLLLANGKLYVGTWTNNSSNLGAIETVNPASMLTDSEEWDATLGSGISGITTMIYDGSYLDAMYSIISSRSADILQLDPTAMTLEHTIIASTTPDFNLLYQPNTIIQGTDLPNLDDDTHATDGVITWGSNPSGETATVGSFQPTTPTQYSGNGSAYGSSPGSTINLTNPIAPAQLYTELDTSKIPFGTAIDDILNAGGIPRGLWWFPFLYLGTIITGGLVYDATQRTGGQGSVLAMAITILVIQTIFGVMGTVGVSGMIPLWSPILFIIPAVALIMSRKHVGWG